MQWRIYQKVSVLKSILKGKIPYIVYITLRHRCFFEEIYWDEVNLTFVYCTWKLLLPELRNSASVSSHTYSWYTHLFTQFEERRSILNKDTEIMRFMHLHECEHSMSVSSPDITNYRLIRTRKVLRPRENPHRLHFPGILAPCSHRFHEGLCQTVNHNHCCQILEQDTNGYCCFSFGLG